MLLHTWKVSVLHTKLELVPFALGGKFCLPCGCIVLRVALLQRECALALLIAAAAAAAFAAVINDAEIAKSGAPRTKLT